MPYSMPLTSNVMVEHKLHNPHSLSNGIVHTVHTHTLTVTVVVNHCTIHTATPPMLTAHGHCVITAPSILPHTHSPMSLQYCRYCPPTLTAHGHCVITAPFILPHTHSPMSLSTLSTHTHCTWSLCDHCTIHTATHSLSNVIVDCSHVLQHMAIVDTDCTIHTDTHSLSTVNVKIFQYLLLAHSFQFGAFDN